MDKLLTIFKVPELRRKILFTAMLLAIYRIGFYVPLPIVNQAQLRNWEEQQSTNTAGKLFGTVAMFGGTSIGMSTIFGLGIMPYISASIIFQLLGSVVPSLEAMMKEGESGRKRINEYTRYATVGLCAVQSAFWVQYMMSPQMNVVSPQYRDFWHGLVCVCIMTAGTIFLMWVGEQIDEYGIGNGISLLIMAGILARVPVALKGLWDNSTSKLTPEPGKYGIITICSCCWPVHRGGRRGDRDHREPAANPDPVGQARARPAGLRRDPAVPAAEGQPGRRHADHLRLQPAHLPLVRLQQPVAGNRWPAVRHLDRRARSSPASSRNWPTPSSGRATSTPSATSS